MTFDLKCENEECPNCGVVLTINVPFEEVNIQKCGGCGNYLIRQWTFSGGIKTSDGYKG